MQSKKRIVAKFGGTSVAQKENRLCVMERIKDIQAQGKAAVVVVSAMGRKGQPYATDTLLSLVRPETKPEIKDLLMSCGETISACVLADELNEAGIPALPFNGAEAGIVTDGVFGSAKITAMDTTAVDKAIEEGFVPVITGFQGIAEDGSVTTLGRGGSDTSAVEIGGWLKAEEVLIYTDVPGIAAGDPRMWKEAPFLKEIDYEDIQCLADWGASVIHPNAVKAGKKFGLPIRVLSTFSTEHGTEIKELKNKTAGLVGSAAKKMGDGTTVVTVLAYPTPEIPANLLPEGAKVTVEGAMVHVSCKEDDAPALLRNICTYCSK